ncbi:MAG: cytidine deaminase [Candidatus Eisenbacteria bacterium]|nr:cytidine deaminase [Candidatus Eisenbacteria bacterium]
MRTRSRTSRAADARAARAAREAAAAAHAPYSGFRVGAVLEDREGRLHAGCNLESASIGLSLCAERAALGIALSRGIHRFRRLFIYTPTARPTRPCGACRDMLLRVAGDLPIVLLCDALPARRTSLGRLLPAAPQRTGVRG